MADFVVEAYLSGVRDEEFRRAAARVRDAAGALTNAGQPVRHMRSVYLRDEETCFHFFEAPSRDAVDAVMKRAGLDFERIGPVETAEAGKGGTE
jgi:hypothetical protein